MRVLIILALLGVAAPALANHPAERIDEVMAEREPAFEAVKGPLPKLALMTDDGRAIELHEQSDKILVLSFVPAGCGAPCADQQRLLNEVQSKIGVTPMGGMVSFVFQVILFDLLLTLVDLLLTPLLTLIDPLLKLY